MQYALSEYYKITKSNRDIFQELMAFKVKEILLVANLYDSYSVAREGEFFDRIVGEYRQLNLYAAPRITNVSTPAQALLALQETTPDMVILMAGLDKNMPLSLAQTIKEHYPDIAILLLVNNNSELNYFGDEGTKSPAIDRVFVWNGDSKVFLAMTKYVEDKKNAANDTRIGDVRIVLLVEDSIRYYTRYLPILYSILMMQTQNVVLEKSADDLHKILKMRGRPKILLASNYEEAERIIQRYADNLLCIISDVNFEKGRKRDHEAGFKLVKSILADLQVPCLIQSGNLSNKAKAEKMGVDFLWKDSDTLSHDIYEFLRERCGFGDFYFKDLQGNKLLSVSTIKAFEEALKTIPESSLQYHSQRQGISSWFMAHSEINLAKQLRRHKIAQNETPEQLRKYILNAIHQNYIQKLRGRVIEFDPNLIQSNRFIVRLGNGSLGGKGRGLAFLSHFIENVNFGDLVSDMRVEIPKTAIVGVEEYDLFIEKNKFYDEIFEQKKYANARHLFANGELSVGLKKKLRTYLESITKPLAIRSSGLFEDSMLQPFAGVYATYFLPNNHPDFEERLAQVEMAIKLVYASIFSQTARDYFQATKYKIEEEKMAVILQEMVGEQHGRYFYPHISGVAQSYNYYPFSYMQPEDGFSVAAVGMGEEVVGGEKSYRFCPRYPQLELVSLADQVKDSQTHFYALDLEADINLLDNNTGAAMLKRPIKEAEKEQVLKHTAQVFDIHNQRLCSDFSIRGPRVVNFANILKYGQVSLAKTLSVLLDFFQQAMGAPVEIEYAMNLKHRGRSSLELLQIKPLIKQDSHIEVNVDTIRKEKAVCVLNGGMGNGHYSHISDVVIMKMDAFNKNETREMAKEVAAFNAYLKNEGREYILIGAGRWGTRDPFIGVPVFWSQIASARIIIEVGLRDLPLEASLGSHFFHNVTSMNVGYFSAPYQSDKNWINMDLIEQQKLVKEGEFFKIIRFEKPLEIKMNGKKRIALIEST